MEGEPGKCPVVRTSTSCHWKDMWQKMNCMRNNGQLCDVRIVTRNNKALLGHSSVLAASSEVFYDCFVGRPDVKCSGDVPWEVYISEIDDDVMQVTLDFIYGVTPVNKTELELLNCGAMHFGLNSAMSYCEKKLERISTEERLNAKKLYCPFKNPDLVKRLFESKTDEVEDFEHRENMPGSEIDASPIDVNGMKTAHSEPIKDLQPQRSACPFLGASESTKPKDSQQIADITAKFIEEVLAQHYARYNKSCSRKTNIESLEPMKRQCGRKPASVDEGSKSNGKDALLSYDDNSIEGSGQSGPYQAVNETHGAKAIEIGTTDVDSQDYQLPTELNTGLGGSEEMPMDIHHSLIPEMTLNDLTRVSECPHLQRLAAESGLTVYSDEMVEQQVATHTYLSPSKPEGNHKSSNSSHHEHLHHSEIVPHYSVAAKRIAENGIQCNYSRHDRELQLTDSRISSPSRLSVNHSSIKRTHQPSSSNSGLNTDSIHKGSCPMEKSDRDVGLSADEAAMKEGPSCDEDVAVTTKCCFWPDRSYECSDCGVVFMSSSQLQKHCLKEHKKGRLFACTDCSFKSPRKKDVQAHTLAKHKKIPHGLKVFRCESCDYVCMDKHRFREHKDSHSGTARFKCTMCKNNYTTRRGLQTHMQYHSKDRPYQCDQCEAQFKVRDKLRDHVRLIHTHPGVKPYKCGYCSHASALRGNCNQHIRRTHQGKPIVVEDLLENNPKLGHHNDYSEIKGHGIEVCHDLSKNEVSFCDNVLNCQ